jgi:cytidyltransferase-like protein
MMIPKLGPQPTLLTRKEIDALYETLSAVQQALNELEIQFIVTGGSLLGAIRQHSILFCDDDIDIAILEVNSKDNDDEKLLLLERVRQHLPTMLPKEEYQYQIEPWPGGDRVRPRKMNNVFLDIFSLRKYNSEEDLRRVIGVKANGQPQPESYIRGILDTIETAAFSQNERAPLYPCWQFATRKAIEMWPKEIYRDMELFPLNSVNMGPVINLSGPRVPVLLLKRAFGQDCFEVYYQSVSHQTSHLNENTGKRNDDNPGQQGQGPECTSSSLPPLTSAGGTWESETNKPQPLQPQHYEPMQPTLKAKRRYTGHNQSTFLEYLESQTLWEMQQLHLDDDDDRGQTDKQQKDNNDNQNMKENDAPTKTIYMDGVFDLFHIGHLKAIQECAKLGNRVIIGVTGDLDATGYKRKPIMDQEERTSIVAALKMVDKVVCPCPLVVTEEFMDTHKIDLVVHGFANEADAERQAEFFEIPMKLGKFQRIPYTEGVSTSERIETMSKGTPPQQCKQEWFGSCVAAATNKSSSIPFDPFPLDLRVVIEPHLRKALRKRSDAIQAIREATGPPKFDKLMSEFQSLPIGREISFEYDICEHDLRRELVKCIPNAGDNFNFDLSRLHEIPTAKNDLFQSLIKSHSDFQEVYDDFVRRVCIPKIQESCQGEERFMYQTFPCIRIVQPGEFSIGPHADVSYGHNPCSINCYILLTDILETESSSVLFLESVPNRQDWHPILGTYGKVTCFPGAISTHWTTDNHTTRTRVSLDFRIIPGSFFESISCGGAIFGGKRDVYRARSGYYSSCRRNTHCWARDGPMLSPHGDPRFGYPWTKTK